MQLLEEAFGIAKEYHDKFIVLEKWLDKSEKKIKDMEVVPTEEDQIQRRIQEHDKLHTEILGKQPSFDDVADVASALMQVVSEEVNFHENSYIFINRYWILAVKNAKRCFLAKFLWKIRKIFIFKF